MVLLKVIGSVPWTRRQERRRVGELGSLGCSIRLFYRMFTSNVKKKYVYIGETPRGLWE